MKIARTKSNGTATPAAIEPGRHVVRIVQVANVGLQRGFNKGEAPTPHLGLGFETEDGVVVARTVRVTATPGSFLFNVVDAAQHLDPDNMTPEARDAFLKLHVELRRAISNRVRSNLDR